MNGHADEFATFHLGDCVEVMATMDAESIDAIVTDPPYGLEFMGKEWDRLGAGTEAATDSPGRRAGHGGAGPESKTNDVPFGGGGKRVRYGSSAKSMQSWHETWAAEAYRVAKPGAHLLAFGGTRTVHRLTSAIEDAGWEIRDTLVWAYASGFPKSLDVSKAIDKAAGAERPVTGSKIQSGLGPDGKLAYAPGTPLHQGPIPTTGPATAAAAAWDGWGTALKPAWEPIVMARKPLVGTVAANVERYGTGALNIDATRIPVSPDDPVNEREWVSQPSAFREGTAGFVTSNAPGDRRSTAPPAAGRWPPNLILTDPIFDGGVDGVVGQSERLMRGDTGTYSRFFLIPKAGRADREPLDRAEAVRLHRERGDCDKLRAWDNGDRSPSERTDTTAANSETGNGSSPAESADTSSLWPIGTYPEKDGRSTDDAAPVTSPKWSSRNVCGECGKPLPRVTSHPTVKPVDLMRHLVRLVTPPRGVVLDCFLGSGTTAIAANMEGFRCIGIEREAEYLEIARARMAHQKIGMGLAE